jgi:hypothetical protein
MKSGFDAESKLAAYLVKKLHVSYEKIEFLQPTDASRH